MPQMPEDQPQNQPDTQALLAASYPFACDMIADSNLRAALALRRWKSNGRNSPRSDVAPRVGDQESKQT